MNNPQIKALARAMAKQNGWGLWSRIPLHAQDDFNRRATQAIFALKSLPVEDFVEIKTGCRPYFKEDHSKQPIMTNYTEFRWKGDEQ